MMLASLLLLPAACLGLVDEGRLPPFTHAAPPPTRLVLRLTDFGGKADGVTNNQVRKTPPSWPAEVIKKGQLQPFIDVFPQQCMGQHASFGLT